MLARLAGEQSGLERTLGARGRRRHPDLRSDPGARPRPRPLVRRAGRARASPSTSRRARSWSSSRPRTRARPRSSSGRSWRTSGLVAGQRLPARLLPRADRPRQREFGTRATRRRSSAASTPRPRRSRRVLRAARRQGRCRSLAARRPRLAKLLENTFRHVNIALVNEIAMLCHELGIDVWEVDRRRRDEAVRVHALLPGPRRRRALHPARPDSYLSWQMRRDVGTPVPGPRAGRRTSTPRCRLRRQAGSPRC